MSKRKGYRRERPVYALHFEDEDGDAGEFAGLEIKASSLTLQRLLELQSWQAMASLGDVDAAERVIERLADSIVAWNLEGEGGQPVPAAYAACTVSGKAGRPGSPCPAHAKEGAEACEYDGLCELDSLFVKTVMDAWMEAMAGVPKRSQENSSSGGTSLELSIPMETL